MAEERGDVQHAGVVEGGERGGKVAERDGEGLRRGAAVRGGDDGVGVVGLGDEWRREGVGGEDGREGGQACCVLLLATEPGGGSVDGW